ncbi:up-regulator of cell proliferation-like [Protopterus annectens]|uniref:up-regulator of cell proliferation-like n=1 Tax=Protopterus annectens TaxID=7888 RepID=UPI001CF9769D|nr:up-regulator of cell proliferation-like [Protopterus annectens]
MPQYTWDDCAYKVLKQLNLFQYRNKKLSLKNVLAVSSKCLEGCAPKSLEDVPWYFLNKVMRSDSNAVDMKCSSDVSRQLIKHQQSDNSDSESGIDDSKAVTLSSVVWIHPLDLIVSVFLCSNPLLQTELMVKMSACQFALPLLLPTWNNSCTFLLLAIRSIIKKWHPIAIISNSKLQEENIVASHIPVFSFLRVGNISVSKSKTLNDILSNKQQYQNIFIHHQMDCANLPRKISNGLGEITWYLPCGSEDIDVFTRPFQIINLRGDGYSFPAQVQFLTLISSAVFVFLDGITEIKLQYLEGFTKNDAQIYLILTSNFKSQDAEKDLLKSFRQKFKLSKRHVIMKSSDINDSDFTRILRSKLQSAVDRCKDTNVQCLEEMVSTAHQCNIKVDEDDEQIQHTKRCSEQIISLINSDDIAQFKCQNFAFQGETCKKLSEIEKKQSRPKTCSESLELHTARLEKDKRQLRQELLKKGVPEIIKSFIDKLTHFSGIERELFLWWLKQKLDSKSQTKMSALRSQYRNTYEALSQTKKQEERQQKQNELKNINNKLSTCSLGLEHFMRELAQIYETLVTEKVKTLKGIPPIDTLPSVAAELMIDGLPLELLNGDAGTIPVKWISAVLKNVSKTVGEKRMFVLTVLGVQSTGKSTLLNTMFGLQFAVSSGRCTRGAFMQLIEITGDLKSQVGYDFLMVIDTEVLKAPELLNVADSYEHDNELATLVIGLSDMTLVNMSMEHSAEMKDVLQIVLHAFIRMKEVGKKPFCVFVHQNIGDITAHDKNLMGHKFLIDQLDEITRTAAKMEKCADKFKKFSDIIAFDPSTSKGYIASLWHGCGPMASVSTGYSASVFNLKKFIFQTILTRDMYKLTFSGFCKMTENIWNAVKMENFLFSFKNSLVAEAYHHLTLAYAEWDWEMRRAVQEWTTQAENKIESNETDICSSLKTELHMLITERKTIALGHLEKYFADHSEKAKLLEEYRQKFIHSIDSLSKELFHCATERYLDTIQRKNTLKEISVLNQNCKNRLEKCISKLLEDCKRKKSTLNDEQLLTYFNKMWLKETNSIQLPPPKNVNIKADMENSLREHMPAFSVHVNKKLKQGIPTWKRFDFKNIMSTGARMFLKYVLYQSDEEDARRKADTIEKKCMDFVHEIVNKDTDYDPSYWFAILRNVDENVRHHETERFSYSNEFIVDLKFNVCCFAVPKFEDMHKKFIEKNDPVKLLSKEKDNYVQLFQALYKTNDAIQTMAGIFAKSSLKPAVIKSIEKKLGSDIVNDMKSSYSEGQFKTRMNFHVAIMRDLHGKDIFEEYVKYICDTVSYEQDWLREKINQHCHKQFNGQTRLFELGTEILNELVCLLRKEIDHAKVNCKTVQELFWHVKERVQKYLVISLKADTFASQTDLQCFVKYLKRDIDEIVKDIKKEIEEWIVDTKIESLPSSPIKILHKTLAGCGNYCFWCGAPCECTEPGHVTHSSNYHRPWGVTGYRGVFTQELTAEFCTTLVASDTLFQNKNTDNKCIPVKEYKYVNDYYRSWIITPDTSLKGSTYWKAVFYKYNEWFAEFYKYLPADVPPEWDFEWEDVCRDIENAYNVRLVENM